VVTGPGPEVAPLPVRVRRALQRPATRLGQDELADSGCAHTPDIDDIRAGKEVTSGIGQGQEVESNLGHRREPVALVLVPPAYGVSVPCGRLMSIS
jgi:hypothetical protein